MPSDTVTGQSLINTAFTNLGVMDQGGTPSVSDSNAALVLLNQQMGQWRISNKFVWSVGKASYPLVLAKQSYQIGPAAPDFNVPRPTYIEQALISVAGPNPANPIQRPMRLIGQQEYAGHDDKAATSTIPQDLYNDRASPISTLYIWPTARCAAPTNLILYTWAQLPVFPDLVTPFDLPDGYSEAITNALAVRCAPMFGTVVNGGTLQVINELGLAAEQRIVELNARARGLMLPPTVPQKGAGQ